MDLQESRTGAVTVIKPVGPLLAADSDVFVRQIEDVQRRSFGRFVVDASLLAFVDSAGLEALEKIADLAAEVGQTIRLCAAGETLREVLELTELADRFEHYSDVNAAVRSFL